MLDHGAARDRRKRASTEHKDRFLTIRPRVELQYALEGLTPDDQRVDCGHELIVSMRFAAARRQEVEFAVKPSDETVEAGSDKNRCSHISWTVLARELPRNGPV